MATSYFRERARNPHLRRMPSLEDDPTVSPTFDQPMSPAIAAPPPLEVIGTPRATAPTVRPTVETPRAFDSIEMARGEYEAKVPTTTGGRILEALKTAGLGFLQGAARDPNDPIAAGIGGAVAGGATSAISPKTGRAFQFETIQRPGIEDQLRREEVQRKRQQGEEDRARAIRVDEARIKDFESQAQARLNPPPKAVAPLRGRPGDVFLDPVTRQPVAQIPAQEKQPQPIRARAGDVFLDPETKQPIASVPDRPSNPPDRAFAAAEELNVLKQAAQDNWTAAKQLPQGSQERLEAETTAREALAVYNQAVAGFGELYGEWFETGAGKDGWSYTKKRQGRTQGAKPQQGGTGITRSRSQFNSNKFPGMKFD